MAFEWRAISSGGFIAGCNYKHISEKSQSFARSVGSGVHSKVAASDGTNADREQEASLSEAISVTALNNVPAGKPSVKICPCSVKIYRRVYL